MAETHRFSIAVPGHLIEEFDESLGNTNRSAAIREGMRLLIWMRTIAHPALAAMINAAAIDPNGDPETFRDMWLQCGGAMKAGKRPITGTQLSLPLEDVE